MKKEIEPRIDPAGESSGKEYKEQSSPEAPETASSSIRPFKKAGLLLKNGAPPLLPVVRQSQKQPPSRPRLLDISTTRIPKRIEGQDFIRPDAWDEVVSIDERPPAGIDNEYRYKKRISSYKRLTDEETQELGKTIQAGNFAQNELELADYFQLTPEEITRQKDIVEKARKAREKLCIHSLGLISYTLKRYIGFPHGEMLTASALHWFDLAQEGYLGLRHAAEKYDPSKGAKFSSTAVPWIRQKINRAIADQRTNIRIPIHAGASRRTYEKTQNELTAKLGREATAEDVASFFGIPAENVADRLLLEKLNNSLIDTLCEPLETIDIDADPDEFANDPDNIPANEMSPETEELLIDQEEERYMDNITGQIGLKEAIDEALNELDERERKILQLRFGLDDGIPRTLEQVGSELGVTRKRIRQIESKTLAKLRHPLGFPKLRKLR